MSKQSNKKFKSTVILDSVLSDSGGGISKPLNPLSLDPASAWGQVEDAFFERGIAEENATIEQYASLSAAGQKLPKVYAIRSGHLLWAGCGLLFLLASAFTVSRFLHQPKELAMTASQPASETLAAVASVVGKQEDPGVLPQPLDAGSSLDSATDGTTAEVASAEVPAAADPVDPVAAIPPSVAPGEVAHATAKPDPVAIASDELDTCRRGLEKKQIKVIHEVCPNALASDPSLVAPLMKWARGEFERGRNAVAVAWANRIAEIDPNQADAYLIIGMSEQAARRFVEARIAYKRYLELAPKGGFARDVRSALSMM